MRVGSHALLLGKFRLKPNIYVTCYTKHEIAWENSKVITTNNRYRDDGAYLPEEYMHLLGR